MHPIFYIFSLEIRAYSLFGVLSILIAITLLFVQLKKQDYKTSNILLLSLSIIVSFLIGARLLNYLVNFQEYIEEGYSILSLNFGRFSLYGGIIFGLIPVYIFLKISKSPILKFADCLTIPFLSSFIVMRVGCFLNGCCYGEFTDSFIGIKSPSIKMLDSLFSGIPILKNTEVKIYPTQLMELFGAMVILILILCLYKKLSGSGLLFFITVGSFSLVRLIVLYFRVLPYPEIVVKVIYPIIYIIFICSSIFGIYKLNRQKTRS